MGETQNQPFQLSFNASLRVDFQGSRVTQRLRRTANKPPCHRKGPAPYAFDTTGQEG